MSYHRDFVPKYPSQAADPFAKESRCSNGTTLLSRGWWKSIVQVKLWRFESLESGLGPPRPLRSLSLHCLLMWGGVPVRIPGHVAVGRHVNSFAGRWHVPYWRNCWRAGRQADGTRHSRVALVRVATCLQQLLELWPFILEPYLYLHKMAGRQGKTRWQITII